MTTEPERDLRDSYRLLSLAARLVERRQDDVLAPLGLTRAAVIALEGIAPGPLNQEQLAALVHVKSQTLGKVLARLEAGGLLTRTRHPTDRRQLVVALTNAGQAALAAARQAENNAFLTGMDTGDWKSLQEELAKVVDSFHAPQRGSPPRSRPHPEVNRPAPEANRPRGTPEAEPLERHSRSRGSPDRTPALHWNFGRDTMSGNGTDHP
ncbi:MAG: MarR family transcriptional regulator [Arthrobacter sp.]|nr:MarR family transcriptional regulator [Arthrobacter sp.]